MLYFKMAAEYLYPNPDVTSTESGKPIITVNRRDIRREDSRAYQLVDEVGLTGLADLCRGLSTEDHIFGMSINYREDIVVIVFTNPIFKRGEEMPNRNNEMIARWKFTKEQLGEGRRSFLLNGNSRTLDDSIENQERYIRNYGWNLPPSTRWVGWIRFE